MTMSGCFIKYTFPRDVPLVVPGGGNKIFSSGDEGILITYNQLSDIEGYSLESDVFTDSMDDPDKNFFIVKGCTNPHYVGPGKNHILKMANFISPAAKR